jgi:hypothetical protein
MLTLGRANGDNIAVGEVRRWRRLLRIAYFDEAGTATVRQEPYLVVGGVLIHGDTQWQPIEKAFLKIREALVPPKLQTEFVFHAMHLFSGHKKYEGLLSPQERFRILHEVISIVPIYKLPIAYTAVKRIDLPQFFPDAPTAELTHEAHQIAFVLCVRTFQRWFTENCADEMAVCVAAKNDQKNRQLELKNNYLHFRSRGKYLLKKIGLAANASLLNFVDALHFASPSESIGLQLADCITFAIKRYVMGKKRSEELYDLLKPGLVCAPEEALWPPGGQRK